MAQNDLDQKGSIVPEADSLVRILPRIIKFVDHLMVRRFAEDKVDIIFGPIEFSRSERGEFRFLRVEFEFF